LERYRALGKTTGPPKEIKNDGRFIAYDDGTVLDTRMNLMWAAKDNGSGISWHGAKNYCENYHAGGYKDWRMPTRDELAELYDVNKSQKAECSSNSSNLIHVVTDLIHLTCWYEWASDTRDPPYTAGGLFAFFDGRRSWMLKEGGSTNRALPVRSVK
jgi:hypothetical protein